MTSAVADTLQIEPSGSVAKLVGGARYRRAFVVLAEAISRFRRMGYQPRNRKPEGRCAG
jgi:hypothetical protein